MGEDKELLLRNIMRTSEIPDFVAIDEIISENEKIEIIPEEEITVKIEAATIDKGSLQRIDLVKLAMYHVQGFNTREISEMFNTSPHYISKIKGSEKFKQVLGVLQHEIVSTARTFLAAAGLKAVKTLLTCMDSGDDRVKLNAATQVLDRIGLKTPEQIELISKGDKIAGMSEEELVEVVKLGMTEILPHTK